MTEERHDRRAERMSGATRAPADRREEFQIDRDRLLYSMAFRRLAGVTQVVSPGEGEIIHNRLTHSLKVAQIARRFAEVMNKDANYAEIIAAWGGLDPDVVETAALAHDLGHPPFGHLAEVELTRLIKGAIRGAAPGVADRATDDDAKGDDDVEGYEGNAQSFRIVTDLSVRRPGSPPGLDLTRASLNAMLKYPWRVGEHHKKKSKYGVYSIDNVSFDFARQHVVTPLTDSPLIRSLEAQIMDWSDDIAYSVHDTEDFYRAGLIPLDRLASNTAARHHFLDEVMERTESSGTPFVLDREIMRYFNEMFDALEIGEAYTGTRKQQESLYDFSSTTIHRFVTSTKLSATPDRNGEIITYPDNIRLEIFFLKQLIWTYVINNPSLATIEVGQRRVIETLFREFNNAVTEKNWAVFPPFFRERAKAIYEEHRTACQMPASQRIRLVADTIASLTDKQALLLYHQFTGLSGTPMFDSIAK